MKTTQYTNIAFISYKREDEKWAKWLQAKLEHYKLPTEIRKQYPDLEFAKNPRHVFKDTTDLSGGVLAKAIKDGLDSSKFLIVICSPRAAKSEWVCKEVQDFIDSGREEYIIPFIIDGEPYSENLESECFPEALKSLAGERELLGININESGRDSAAVKVVARLFELKFDVLWDRFGKEVVRRRLIYTITSVFILTTLVVFGLYSFFSKRLQDILRAQNTEFEIEYIIEDGHVFEAEQRLLELVSGDIDNARELITPELEFSLRMSQASYANKEIFLAECNNFFALRGRKVYSFNKSLYCIDLLNGKTDIVLPLNDLDGYIRCFHWSPNKKKAIFSDFSHLYYYDFETEKGGVLKIYSMHNVCNFRFLNNNKIQVYLERCYNEYDENYFATEYVSLKDGSSYGFCRVDYESNKVYFNDNYDTAFKTDDNRRISLGKKLTLKNDLYNSPEPIGGNTLFDKRLERVDTIVSHDTIASKKYVGFYNQDDYDWYIFPRNSNKRIQFKERLFFPRFSPREMSIIDEMWEDSNNADISIYDILNPRVCWHIDVKNGKAPLSPSDNFFVSNKKVFSVDGMKEMNSFPNMIDYCFSMDDSILFIFNNDQHVRGYKTKDWENIFDLKVACFQCYSFELDQYANNLLITSLDTCYAINIPSHSVSFNLNKVLSGYSKIHVGKEGFIGINEDRILISSLDTLNIKRKRYRTEISHAEIDKTGNYALLGFERDSTTEVWNLSTATRVLLLTKTTDAHFGEFCIFANTSDGKSIRYAFPPLGQLIRNIRKRHK